ncbi:MAG: hypothetical protein OHK0053_03800 [Microscillaceae bacterium]
MLEEPRKDVFEKEVESLTRAKSILNREDFDRDALLTEYESLSRDYEKLLGDARVMTNVSDRLHHRLNRAYDKINQTLEDLKEAHEELTTKAEEIERKRQLLETTNNLLQNTIDELTRTRISKKATTIALLAAILLFFASEIFLEPLVESIFNLGKEDSAISFLLKGSIALLLKPIDYLVEWYLMRDIRRKTRRPASEPPTLEAPPGADIPS